MGSSLAQAAGSNVEAAERISDERERFQAWVRSLNLSNLLGEPAAALLDTITCPQPVIGRREMSNDFAAAECL